MPSATVGKGATNAYTHGICIAVVGVSEVTRFNVMNEFAGTSQPCACARNEAGTASPMCKPMGLGVAEGASVGAAVGEVTGAGSVDMGIAVG